MVAGETDVAADPEERMYGRAREVTHRGDGELHARVRLVGAISKVHINVDIRALLAGKRDDEVDSPRVFRQILYVYGAIRKIFQYVIGVA